MIVGGNNVMVEGTASDDEFTVTPTSASDATITVDGQPTVTAQGIGDLTIDPAGGSDTVRVIANETANTIAVTETSVSIMDLETVNLDTADTEALHVDAGADGDTITVTPSTTVRISIDGGDPTGAGPGLHATSGRPP